MYYYLRCVLLATFSLFVFTHDVWGLRNVILTLEPTNVQHSHHCTLRCSYDLEGAPLYTVKWYRGLHEFYRYTPNEYPNTKIFPIRGINVDVNQSNSTQVVLRNVEFNLSGNFSCEVTTEEDFSTVVDTKAMLVIRDCNVPTIIYDDLKCIPKYDSGLDACPIEYDCSHIYNRASGTCHLKGKFYNYGEQPHEEDIASSCREDRCRCEKNGTFSCELIREGCPEYWSKGFIKPGCFLTHELNRCCSTGHVCPSEGTPKCVVNGETYLEGVQFPHPTQKCTTCVCIKDFNGSLDAPVCQRQNCSMELIQSKRVDDYCAPLYIDVQWCCPILWVCPEESGIYTPTLSVSAHPDLKCRFGEKFMQIGETYASSDPKYGDFSCSCVVPPYLTCILR